MISPLISNLKELAIYAELIIFTILPKAFVDQLLKKIPELCSIFSYIFCSEDLIQTN